MQELIWTVLPQGINQETGVLYFSLMVSPRLDLGAGGRLGDSVMATWPEVLSERKLSLRFNGGAAVAVDFDRDQPELNRWQDIFSYDTPLSHPAFDDHSSRPLHSFSASTLHREFDTLYRTVAAESPTEFPSLNTEPVLKLLDAVRLIEKQLRAYGDGFSADFNEVKESILDSIPADNRLARELFRLRNFYQRPGDKWTHEEADGDEDIKKGELREVLDTIEQNYDFHEVVALFGDYPELLQRLGLLVPCWIRFDPETIPYGSGDHTVQAVVDNWDSAAQNYCPKTAYTLYPDEGILQPSTNDLFHIKDGLLRLDNQKRYEVIQTDVDGTGAKLIQFAANMVRRLDVVNPTRKIARPEQDSLPSRRNSGFTIIERNRKARLADRFEISQLNNESLDDPDEIVLYAQDLLRGYRLDVDYNGQWHSLCRRRGTIEVEGSASEPIAVNDEEGYVKSAGVTSSALSTATKDIYVHEGLLGWDGWSLCVLRPGRALVNEDTGDGNVDDVRWVENTAETPYGVHTNFKVVPFSLPPLRFGRVYRFRARTVDLSGHSLPLKSPNEEGVTDAVRYARYEPVETSALVPRAHYTEGESLEHMVVRSDRGKSAEQYAEEVDSGLGVGTDSEDKYEYLPENDRHVASPKASQLLCEHNGDFDGAFGPAGDIGGYYELAKREAGTFMDEIGEVELCGPPGADVPDISTYEPGEGLQEGQYVIHKETQLKIPYLPDSLAQGFVLREAQTKEEIFRHSWDLTGWPFLNGFRVVLGETDTPDIVVAEGDDHVFIGLPQAKKLKVLLSSFLDSSSLNKLGMYWDGVQQLIDNGATRTEVGEWRAHALNGENWLLTPYKTLTLVHAVQRPIRRPVFVNPYSRRRPDETHAELRFDLDVHGWSTGKMDPQAIWKEYLDIVDEETWRTEARTGAAEEVPVAYDDVLIPRCMPKHEFGDTKHRMVTYTPVGTTRYLEYFPAEIIADKEQITLDGPSATISVPSSARPDVPKVSYLIPTFRWEKPDKGTSIRRGRSVRIYLERPWFSSGQDEKVAVLLQPSGFWIGRRPPQYDFVSHWGRDPLWYGDVEPRTINADAFENTEQSVEGLQLDELPEGVLVNAVVFTPVFNDTRGMWYVDIDLDPGDEAYYPFVSFALARYQAESLTNLELSRVTRAECMQLTADRTATMSQRMQGQVSIEVFGPSGKGQRINLGEGLSPEHKVRACIQEIAGDPQSDLGWEAITDYVELSPSTSHHQTTWSGTLSLPGPTPKDSYRRVLIEEMEIYLTDARVSETELTMQRDGRKIKWIGKRGRLVYMDTFPLWKG